MVFSLIIEDEIHLAYYKDNIGKMVELKFSGKKKKINVKIKRVIRRSNIIEIIIKKEDSGMLHEYLSKGFNVVSGFSINGRDEL